MTIKIENLTVASDKENLQDVVEKALVSLKEFDDSSVDYEANPDAKKPIEIKEEVFFIAPKEDSFIPIENVTKDVVLNWIESMDDVIYVFNRIMQHNVRIAELKEEAKLSRLKVAEVQKKWEPKPEKYTLAL